MKKIGAFAFRWKYAIVVVVGIAALFVIGRSDGARADVKDKLPTEEQMVAVRNRQLELYTLDRGDLIRKDGKLFLVEHRMQHNTHSMIMACLECSPKDFNPDGFNPNDSVQKLPEVIKKGALQYAEAWDLFILQKK